MRNAVEGFYNDFSRKLLQDYIYGNRRVYCQFEFLRDAISANTQRILVIGCGSGEVARFIATRMAKNARILAVDISSENISLANILFSHARVEYLKADVLTASLPGTWDVIVLPDVYEHIPADARGTFHAILDQLLSEKGKIVLTLPSPGHQDFLRNSGKVLQIVDETVTLDHLIIMARDVGSSLTYFSMISVWRTNDYIHAVIERGIEFPSRIREEDRLPLKRQDPSPEFPMRIWARVSSKVHRAWRRLRVYSKLESKGIPRWPNPKAKKGSRHSCPDSSRIATRI